MIILTEKQKENWGNWLNELRTSEEVWLRCNGSMVRVRQMDYNVPEYSFCALGLGYHVAGRPIKIDGFGFPTFRDLTTNTEKEDWGMDIYRYCDVIYLNDAEKLPWPEIADRLEKVLRNYTNYHAE